MGYETLPYYKHTAFQIWAEKPVQLILIIALVISLNRMQYIYGNIIKRCATFTQPHQLQRWIWLL